MPPSPWMCSPAPTLTATATAGAPAAHRLHRSPPCTGCPRSPCRQAALDDAVTPSRNAGHELVRATPPYPADLGCVSPTAGWPASPKTPSGSGERLEVPARKMVRAGRRRGRKVKPASDDRFVMPRRPGSPTSTLSSPLPLHGRPSPLGPGPKAGYGRCWRRQLDFHHPLEPGRVSCGVRSLRLRWRVPIGLQLVAPADGEQTVLSLAGQLEQLRPWPATATENP